MLSSVFCPCCSLESNYYLFFTSILCIIVIVSYSTFRYRISILCQCWEGSLIFLSTTISRYCRETGSELEAYAEHRSSFLSMWSSAGSLSRHFQVSVECGAAEVRHPVGRALLPQECQRRQLIRRRHIHAQQDLGPPPSLFTDNPSDFTLFDPCDWNRRLICDVANF